MADLKEDENEPECNCFTMFEWEGRIIHYADCAVIQYRLGV